MARWWAGRRWMWTASRQSLRRARRKRRARRGKRTGNLMMERIFSWDTLWYFFLVLYVLACPFLITIVLLQKGKGTGFAGSFGAGAGPGSETVFGPRAGQTLPVRLTYIAAGI